MEYVLNNNNVLKFIRYENAPKYTISSKRTKFIPRRKIRIIERLTKKKLEEK